MFSIFTTVLSIAIVAVLALITLTKGGAIYQQAVAEITASKILLQGQQVLGAAEMYRATHGDWPPSLATLAGYGNYLSVIPSVEGQQWKMPLEGYPVFVLQTRQPPACQSVNKKMLGVDGVLASARVQSRAQCYGLTLNSLQIVFSRDSGSLVQVGEDSTASPPVGAVGEDPLPASDATQDWVIAPAVIHPREDCPVRTPPEQGVLRRRVFCPGDQENAG